jgi:acyl dehydratase
MDNSLTKQCERETLKAKAFSVTYSAKDVMLFALAIGFGADEECYERDLRYLHEEHEEFEVVPLWGLAVPFWAHQNGARPLLPAFPPPLMSTMGLIPQSHLLGQDINLQDYPVLHMFQSIEWHSSFPPVSKDLSTIVNLHASFKSIQPKSIGTFVTTESIVVHETTPICSIQSTALILGLPPDYVIPLSATKRLSNRRKLITNSSEKGAIWLEKTQKVDSNVALLYRIASGDTNRIHVLPVVSEKPLLHGLCTMAIAATFILQQLPDGTPTMLQGNFTKPVFVNDTIQINVWKRLESLEFDFVVYNQTKGEVCLDHGYFALKRREECGKRSRL